MATTADTETYQCLSCDHTFQAPPGPVEKGINGGACPRCDHVYVKWLTYEQNFVRRRHGRH